MRRMIFLITLVLTLSLACISTYADAAIKVSVNGINLVMNESPVIINGRTLVPLRAIFEALGVTPIWDGNTNTVSAKTSTVDMSLIIGGNAAMVNNRLVSLEAPGTLVNGSTMVPARFIAETFGATVGWDGATSTVNIVTELNTTSKSKVPYNFTDGYELAVFSKFNSFASVNGLGGTKVYLDCVIDKIIIMDTDAGEQIVAYLIDNDKNYWVALLHTMILVDENEYSSIVRKPIIFCGVYDGYSRTEKMPFVYLDKLCVKETGDIKSGLGKSISEN